MKFFRIFALSLILLISITSIVYAGDKGITKFGSDIYIEKNTSVDKAVAIGGSIKVVGNVQEDVVAIGGNVELTNSAIVLGDVVTIGGKLKKAPGAIIKGEIVEIGVPGSGAWGRKESMSMWGLGFVLFKLASFAGVLILALILVAFATKQIGMASSAAEKNGWRSFWVGLLAMISIVPIALLLLVSIVGIIFVPLWGLLVVTAFFFAKVVLSQLIGKKLLKLFKIDKKPMPLEVALGLIVLSLIGMVPILGGIALWALGTIALGAIVLTRFGTQKA